MIRIHLRSTPDRRPKLLCLDLSIEDLRSRAWRRRHEQTINNHSNLRASSVIRSMYFFLYVSVQRGDFVFCLVRTF